MAGSGQGSKANNRKVKSDVNPTLIDAIRLSIIQ